VHGVRVGAVAELGIEVGEILVVHTPGVVTEDQAREIADAIRPHLAVEVPIVVAPRPAEFVVAWPVSDQPSTTPEERG
jgi:hypothetical protein